MKKADKRPPRPKKAKDELTMEELKQLTGGRRSLRARGLEGQVKSSDQIQIVKTFTP